MLRIGITSALALALLVGAEHRALAQTSSPCSAVRDHLHDTVIVFRPPSAFTICRNGVEEDGVVTGRRVYLELEPTPASRMFDFRVHGQSGEWAPMGLAVWEELTSKIASKLRDLDHSGESIADLVIPLDASAGQTAPLRPVAIARTRYLADVTPRYLEALHSVRGEARELPVVARVVKQWCSALATDAAATAESELHARCAAPELADGAVDHVVEAFEAAAKKETAQRDKARDATLNAIAHPDDSRAVEVAARELDDARVAANAVVAAGHLLRESSAALARDVATLRVALRSIDTIRPGVPTYLSTYSSGGNAELEIDATPIDAAAVSRGSVPPNAGRANGRFPIFDRHYLDLEAGLGWTAGLPQVPYSSAVNGIQTIQTKPVDEFVGLALVELEPLRFLWPERPLAGVLRLPTIGIPFTRDPTQNFFVGGGLGWTGIGSITVGPYFLNEITLRNGYAPNQQLLNGTTLGAATVAGLRVGYFASASIDLVGLFHLFVPTHVATIDAVTGKEK